VLASPQELRHPELDIAMMDHLFLACLGDAVWSTLVALARSALPFGVLGAAAGSYAPRRRRARERAGLVPSS
jgi:hypothetical protein